MNELKVFQNEVFGSVRMLNVNGKPYAVANDIAKALGYKNTNDAIIKNCKGVVKCDTLTSGGIQQVNVIPQGDIIRLAVKCTLEGAEKFESWIFDDVIPSVMNNGMYATEVTVDKMLNDPDFAINLLTKLKEERQARVEAERTNAILMHINKTYTITNIAKHIYNLGNILYNAKEVIKNEIRQNKVCIKF